MKELKVCNQVIHTPIVGSLPTPTSIWTWDMFGDDVTNITRQQVYDWYGRQWAGMPNTRYAPFLLTAFGEECPHKINLFKNGYGSRLDFRKIDVVLDNVEMIYNVGALPIMTLFNDDRTAINAPLSIQKQVIKQFVSLMGPFVKVWNIGLEVTEYMSNDAILTYYQMFKDAGAEIVGIHAQWDFTNRPQLPKCDVLFSELCDPNKGNDLSASEMKSRGADVLNRCTQQGVACVFAEYNFLGERMKEQTRALLELNPAGVGGPV